MDVGEALNYTRTYASRCKARARFSGAQLSGQSRSSTRKSGDVKTACVWSTGAAWTIVDCTHTGRRPSVITAKQQQVHATQAPVVPEQYVGSQYQEAYLAGYKVTLHEYLLAVKPPDFAVEQFTDGFAGWIRCRCPGDSECYP